MTAEYPREQQNPPTIPGSRPTDAEQPAPAQRVPKHFEQKDGADDPRGIDSGWQGGEHLEGFQEKHAEEQQEK